MTVNCLLLGSPTLGWYLGVVVLDVVRGERVLDLRMFKMMHVQTFVEVCTLFDDDRRHLVRIVSKLMPITRLRSTKRCL
jgi:hypothetical protein